MRWCSVARLFDVLCDIIDSALIQRYGTVSIAYFNSIFSHHLSFNIWMEYEDSFHDLETLKKNAKFPWQFNGTEVGDFSKF